MTIDLGDAAASGTKSTVKIVANIFISFIGAGVLGLPYAFKEAGILEGISIMMFVGILSVKAMLLLIDCKYRLIRKNPGNSKTSSSSNGIKKEYAKNGATAEEEMEDLIRSTTDHIVTQIEEPNIPMAPGQELTYEVGYFAIGHVGKLLVDIAIVVSQIGFCCAYIIFITENISDYIVGLKLWHWLILLLPPLGGLTLLRHLSSLAISSLFAQLSNLLAFAVVFWFDFEHFNQIERIHPKEFSLAGFPFFLAVSMYCYEGAGMILSLEASLAKEIRHHFKFYFKGTLGIVTFMYISFGVCGYLSFGPHTNAIITLNLPVGDGLDFAMVVKSCLCLALFFTYPVMLFPVVQLFEKKIFTKAAENVRAGNLLRFAVVGATGLIVLAIPNFANLMALVGSTCCTLLAFILPGIFHMKIFKGSLTKKQFALDVFLIALGISGGIVGTLDAMKRMNGATTGRAKIIINENVTTLYPVNATFMATHLPQAIDDMTTGAMVGLTTTTTTPPRRLEHSSTTIASASSSLTITSTKARSTTQFIDNIISTSPNTTLAPSILTSNSSLIPSTTTPLSHSSHHVPNTTQSATDSTSPNNSSLQSTSPIQALNVSQVSNAVNNTTHTVT